MRRRLQLFGKLHIINPRHIWKDFQIFVAVAMTDRVSTERKLLNKHRSFLLFLTAVKPLRFTKIAFACWAIHVALTMLLAVLYAAFKFQNYNILIIYLCLGWIIPFAFWRQIAKRLS